MSWTQANPEPSLRLIARAHLAPGAALLDVGAGLGNLPVALKDADLRLTVLDISGEALRRAQARLGGTAACMTWVEGDVTQVELPESVFELWHDRAVLHFLTEEGDRVRYLAQLRRAVKPGGWVILATFAPDGPERCSGLPVRRYSAEDLQAYLGKEFALEECFQETHATPMGSTQSFTWTLFRRAGLP